MFFNQDLPAEVQWQILRYMCTPTAQLIRHEIEFRALINSPYVETFPNARRHACYFCHRYVSPTLMNFQINLPQISKVREECTGIKSTFWQPYICLKCYNTAYNNAPQEIPDSMKILWYMDHDGP
jgi:hypothetical protein